MIVYRASRNFLSTEGQNDMKGKSIYDIYKHGETSTVRKRLR